MFMMDWDYIFSLPNLVHGLIRTIFLNCQSKLKRVEGKYQTAGGVLIVWYDDDDDDDSDDDDDNEDYNDGDDDISSHLIFREVFKNPSNGKIPLRGYPPSP